MRTLVHRASRRWSGHRGTVAAGHCTVCHDRSYHRAVNDAFSEEAFRATLPGLLAGSSESQETFFRLARGYLLGATHAFGQVRDADREDFILEIIEKALSKLDRYCPAKGGFRTWIFVMARFHAYDKGRKLRDGHDVLHGALDERAFEWTDAAAPAPSDGDEEETAPIRHRPELAKIHAVLAGLPPEDQRLAMALSSGCPVVEVGEELGLKPDAVRKRYSRLKERIREVFASDPEVYASHENPRPH